MEPLNSHTCKSPYTNVSVCKRTQQNLLRSKELFNPWSFTSPYTHAHSRALKHTHMRERTNRHIHRPDTLWKRHVCTWQKTSVFQEIPTKETYKTAINIQRALIRFEKEPLNRWNNTSSTPKHLQHPNFFNAQTRRRPNPHSWKSP